MILDISAHIYRFQEDRRLFVLLLDSATCCQCIFIVFTQKARPAIKISFEYNQKNALLVENFVPPEQDVASTNTIHVSWFQTHELTRLSTEFDWNACS